MAGTQPFRGGRGTGFRGDEPGRSPAALASGALGAPRPSTEAVALQTPPVIDGDGLGDPVWKRITPATGFWQTTARDTHAFTGKLGEERA